MRINHTLPLEIRVLSYRPQHHGFMCGHPDSRCPDEPAEIEFEIRTLTGHELSESDFGPHKWGALEAEVLSAYEAELKQLRDEAQITVWEDTKYWSENRP